jgi:epoxyqueuosine reductase
MLIHPEAGSYFFLGEVLTSVELEPKGEMEDLCGTCTACIEACPTGAIVGPRVVDARRCISYLTIELRGAIPESQRSAVGEHLFGCDVCQEVCPWNRRAAPGRCEALGPAREVVETTLMEAVLLDEDAFATRFRRTSIARTHRSGFVRNALVVAANRSDSETLAAGAGLLGDPDPAVRETAVWALARGDSGERRRARRAAESEPDPALRERMLAATD